VADPLLVSWPRGIGAKGELRHQFLHATDIAPTIYDLVGVELPEAVKGFEQLPLEGVSFRSTFESDEVPTPKESAFFSMLGSRAVWKEGWKAVSVHPTIAGWGHFDEDRWELFHTDEDPTENRDLAAENPEKLQELIDHWFHLADLYNGLPLMDKTAVEVLSDPNRPQVSAPRDRYVYYPQHAEVPEAQAVVVRGRSFVIGALVDLPGPGAQGVLFAQGSRFGGHALYVKDNRLHYVNSFVGILEQKVVATEELPVGENLILSASFVKDGTERTPVATGTLSLYHGDTKVGEGQIKLQPGSYMIAGEGLAVGRDVGDPVTDDYPGDQPHRFTGGTIRRVAVDVSGEPYIDLEREAQGMLMRE
jgi:hypothetical protein